MKLFEYIVEVRDVFVCVLRKSVQIHVEVISPPFSVCPFEPAHDGGEEPALEPDASLNVDRGLDTGKLGTHISDVTVDSKRLPVRNVSLLPHPPEFEEQVRFLLIQSFIPKRGLEHGISLELVFIIFGL